MKRYPEDDLIDLLRHGWTQMPERHGSVYHLLESMVRGIRSRPIEELVGDLSGVLGLVGMSRIDSLRIVLGLGVKARRRSLRRAARSLIAIFDGFDFESTLTTDDTDTTDKSNPESPSVPSVKSVVKTPRLAKKGKPCKR